MHWANYSRLFSFIFITVVFTFLSFNPCPVSADTDPSQIKNDENVTESAVTKTARIPPGLGAHKPTYAIFTWSSYDEDRKNEEIKYQISFKQRIFPWGYIANENKKYKLYFGFTIKSFWQVFDKSNSSPFRETNYNPEIFLRTPEFQTQWGKWRFDIGGEHESNGQNIPASRSWDRLYVNPRWEKGIFSADYKLWYRIKEDEKSDADDTQGDDNPDIEDYYGHSELNLRVDLNKRTRPKGAMGHKIICFDKSGINVMLRYNFNKGNGAIQVDYWVPLINAMKLYFQYWNGYGESLIDYNISFTKFGGGLALTI